MPTLIRRKACPESLTHVESDRAVRIACIVSLAEKVFSDEAKATRWLRKSRFDGAVRWRCCAQKPLQLGYGFVA